MLFGKINRLALRFLLFISVLGFASWSCGGLNEEKEILSKLGVQWGDSYQRPEILSVDPPDGSFEIEKTRRIVIDFSKSMDKISTEASVVVAANGGNSNFSPSWVFDSRLILDFTTGLTEGKKYEITLNKSGTKDTEGNTLSKNYLTRFYTVGGGKLPSVTSSNPPNTGALVVGWPVDQNIVIQFSEPMEDAVTVAAVSIAGGPALFLPVWNVDRTVLTLSLKSNLEIGTNYTLKVASSAKSVSGIQLASDYQVIFSTGSVFTRPQLQTLTFGTVNIAPTPEPTINPVSGVSKFTDIRFDFSESMDRSSVLDAISFSPSISGVYSWNGTSTAVTFTPNQALQSTATYRVKMASSAKSAQGQLLSSGYIADFLVDDITDSRPIALPLSPANSVIGHSFDNSPGCPISATNELNFVGFPNQSTAFAVTPQAACVPSYMIEVRLNTSGGAALATFGDGDVFSSSTISAEYLSGGPITSNIKIAKIDYIPSANPQIVKVFLSGLSGNAVRYKFGLKGGSSGIRDTNGNILSQDLEFIFYGL
ncbi:hypothetical protein CH373_10475 [Leptospira perolatii]|uniref:SbsA Ig-like domain-containing protein n=1 Tax=Leptospira perolatii TaxID=2023191 RepID=A0A2M9ZMV4_9LEPT|nr:Ig-like domain-containing protein [Leptospira perolatii]PJZ68274.1 hypothetical protein CH360_16995 [Leptospira perolatii]PJZ73375.1 hypothetical protein CH373_10475 [Leptospira perolatii]